MPIPVDSEVDIQDNSPGSQLAWCPGTNYVAMSVTDGPFENAGICLLNPSSAEVTKFHCHSTNGIPCLKSPDVMKSGVEFLQEHALLSIPGDHGANRQVTNLEWSPLDSKRQLLAADSNGNCTIWSQTPASACMDSIVTCSDWQCQQTLHFLSAPGATCFRTLLH